MFAYTIRQSLGTPGLDYLNETAVISK